MWSKSSLASMALFGLSGAYFSSVPEAEVEATQFAMTYEYPINTFGTYAQPILESVGTNKFYHQRQPASPGNETILPSLLPDADTLSSNVIIDLSQRNLELTVPAGPAGQYWVFSFYDIWGNNFANVGTASGTTGGKYLLQSSLDMKSSKAGLQAETNAKSTYKGYINFSGRYGTILQRYELPTGNSSLAAVHKLQDQSVIKEVTRPASGAPQAPKLTVDFLGVATSAPGNTPDSLEKDVDRRLEAFARIAPFNPAEEAADRDDLDRIFAMAGVSNGTYKTPSRVNITEAVYGLRDVDQAEAGFAIKNNGWTQSARETQGNFHGDYGQRSVVSFSNFLQQIPEEALYPLASNATQLVVGEDPTPLGSGALPIGADQSILLSFSDKPPVNGYWSVTNYNSEGQFIKNSLNRYSIGSRSDITYANGDKVYGGKTSSGPFQILIQPADVAPPKNWTSNWLPSPAGASNTTIILRFYASGEALLDNSYKLPTISTQDAIKA